MGNLATIKLNDNELSIGLPTELGELSDLAELTLTSNNLLGTLPSELGQMGVMETLALQVHIHTRECARAYTTTTIQQYNNNQNNNNNNNTHSPSITHSYMQTHINTHTFTPTNTHTGQLHRRQRPDPARPAVRRGLHRSPEQPPLRHHPDRGPA